MRTTRLTIQNFIKDRIQEGSLVVTASNKKSRKTLALGEQLKSELEEYFRWITENDELLDASDRDSTVQKSALTVTADARSA
jgi:hypothetical protein